MEFLVEFDARVPPGTPDAEVARRQRAESVAAAELAGRGHLVRLWRRPLVGDGTTAVGLYRADSAAQLDRMLAALPLADWLHVTVTPLEPHPNDPAAGASFGSQLPAMGPGSRRSSVSKWHSARRSTWVKQRRAAGASCPSPAGRSPVPTQREAAPGRQR